MRAILIVLALFSIVIAENDLINDMRDHDRDGLRQCEAPDSPISCANVDVLLKRPSDDDIFRPRRMQIVLLIVVVFSNVCAFGAVFFHWWNGYVVFFMVYRRLLVLEKKITTCQERMGKRAFSEQLIGKLAHMAHFDFTANQNEADALLKSMAVN